MAANISTKRKITDYFDFNPRKSKKRKLNKSKPTPHCKIFKNVTGITCLFRPVFTSVLHSGLVSSLSVPSEIVREIAEFGTGDVVECGITHCDHKIRLFANGIASTDHYEFDGELNLFYCSDCSRNYDLLWHCRECDKWIYVGEQGKECDDPGCDVFFHEDCYQDDCSTAYAFECLSCTKTLCPLCKFVCDNCEESFCGECDMDLHSAWNISPNHRFLCGQCQLSFDPSGDEDRDIEYHIK